MTVPKKFSNHTNLLAARMNAPYFPRFIRKEGKLFGMPAYSYVTWVRRFWKDKWYRVSLVQNYHFEDGIINKPLEQFVLNDLLIEAYKIQHLYQIDEKALESDFRDVHGLPVLPFEIDPLQISEEDRLRELVEKNLI